MDAAKFLCKAAPFFELRPGAAEPPERRGGLYLKEML